MTGKVKLITYAFGGLAIIAAAYFLVVSPALTKVSNLSAEELATRTEVMRLDQQILAYRTAQSDLSRATSKNLLFSSVVNDKNLFVPIEELELAVTNTNSSHQLKILRDSLAPGPAGAPAAAKVLDQVSVEEVPYVLTAQNADYGQMINLFKYLENLPHYTEVSEIDMSYQTEGELANQLTAVIKGVFLVKPK